MCKVFINLHDKNLRNYSYLWKLFEYIHQNNEISQKRKVWHRKRRTQQVNWRRGKIQARPLRHQAYSTASQSRLNHVRKKMKLIDYLLHLRVLRRNWYINTEFGVELMIGIGLLIETKQITHCFRGSKIFFSEVKIIIVYFMA